MKKTLILSFFILSNIHAQEANFLEKLIESTNDYRKTFHQSAINISSSIDGYFIEKELKNSNYDTSFIHIELSSFSNENHSLKFDQKIRLRLKLPKLKDQFRIELESDEIRQSNDNIEDHTQNQRNENYNLALAYYKNLKNNIDLNTKLGIRLRHKLDPFLRINLKKTWNINEEFEYTLSQRLNQSVIKKLESTTYLRLDKKLNDTFSIHNYYEHYWHSMNDQYNEVYTSIYLQQKLSSKAELTYTINSSINNINDEIENQKTELRPKRYALNLRYRKYLKSWLYYDIIPEVHYNEENNFSKDNYAARFNLGIYFNKGSYK